MMPPSVQPGNIVVEFGASSQKRNPKQGRLGLLELPQLKAPKRSGRGVGGWGAAQLGVVSLKGRLAFNNYGIVLRLGYFAP
jgi:hypothetical protein